MHFSTPALRLRLALALLVAPLLATLGAAAPAGAHAHATKWDCIAHYESTHRWAVNTGNGHYGGLQFSLSTWRAYGGQKSTGNRYPHRATRREQIKIAKRVAFTGWGRYRAQGGRNAWPNTWSRCF